MLSFPSSPTTGQEHTTGGKTWVWDGARWAPKKETLDFAEAIHAAPAKTTPADADEFGYVDSAAGWSLKKLTWANLKAALASLFVSKSGDTVAGNLTVQGSLMTTVGPLGYGPGAGGTVTQTGSKTAYVALNKPCGVITTAAGVIPANGYISFDLFNNMLALNDILLPSVLGGVYGTEYQVWTSAVVNGKAIICIKNNTGASRDEVITISFAIIKIATS